MSKKVTNVPQFVGGDRASAPKHDVVIPNDEELRSKIQEYADCEGITFDEAASAFASRGVSRVKSDVRKSLRGR